MSNSLSSMTGMAEPPPSPLGATDSTEDSDEEEDEDEDSDLDDWEPRLPLPFTPHSLCTSPPRPPNALGARLASLVPFVPVVKLSV